MDRLEKIKIANEYLWKLRTFGLNEDKQKKLVKEMSKKLKLVGIGRKNPKKVWELVYRQLNAGICVKCGNLYPMEELEVDWSCDEWEGYCPDCLRVYRWSLRGYMAKLFAKHGLNVSPEVIPLMMELEVDGFEINEDFIKELCEFAKSNGEAIVNEKVVRLFFEERGLKRV